MKILKYQIIWLLLTLPFLNGYSQSDSRYFYYHKGQKVFLEADRQSIAISWEGDINSAKLSSSLATSRTRLSTPTEDNTRNTLAAIDQKASARKGEKTYYLEVSKDNISTQADYEKEIEGYKRLSNVIMASPCFNLPEGKKMGLSNNLYVKLKNASEVDILYKEAAKLNLEVMGYNEFMPLWFVLSTGKSTKINALDAANILYETGLFDKAEPAFMYHDLAASADPLFPNQWGLKNTGQFGAAYAGTDMKVEEAWTITAGSASTKVAVFDQGFEMDHPDLQGNTFGTGYDANTGTSPAKVRGDHGTACAGIIGAVQNTIGGSGIAPGSKLISISINLSLNDPPISLANGFNWACQNGADVISNSWGGYAPSSIIDDAITNAFTIGRGGKGTVIVFAAGNENNTSIRYPGNSNPLILVIGALSPCGERKSPSSCEGETWWGSCFGSQLDVMAPGVKIATTDRQGAAGYDPSNFTLAFNGTSSACPNAAGVVALVLSANPDLTVQQVNDIIERSAQKVRTDLYSYGVKADRPNGTWNSEMGYGLIDAYQAVLMASSASCYANLTVSADVIAPYTDNRQASSTITAVNTINAGAAANYHAGEKVVLSTGFRALKGSAFDAYIQGCTGTLNAQPNKPSAEVARYDYQYNAEEPITSVSSEILEIIPNSLARESKLQYTLDSDQLVSLKVQNMMGKVVSSVISNQQTKAGSHSIIFDSSDLPSGIYIVVLTTEKGIVKKRAIKE